MLTTIPPSAPDPRPTPGPLRNGNPRGNPHLSPRCGAKARTTGCPCQAPAMPNGRCRMHGGKCKGPATPAGKARMTEANTKHGKFAAPARTRQRYIRTLIRRTDLLAAARTLWPYLPPEMSDRLAAGPEELSTPIHPSNLPYLTKQQRKLYRLTILLPPTTRYRAPPPFRTAERQAAEAEAAIQAPWREAIAQARALRRAHRAAKRAARQARAAARQSRRENRQNPLTGRNAMHSETTAATPGPHRNRQLATTQRNAIHSENHAPTAGSPSNTTGLTNVCTLSDLEWELAARRAGLRGPRYAHLQPNPSPNPNHDSAPTERNATHSETTAPTPGPNGSRQTQPTERNAIHSDRHPTTPKPTRLSATQATYLRTTTLAEAAAPALHPLLAHHFGHPTLTPGWRIPQIPPPTNPEANATRALLAAPKPQPTTGRQSR